MLNFQTRKFFALPHEIKMEAKHPPKVNRGYRFVGQENVASISGYEKGRGPGTTHDIKVDALFVDITFR